MSHEEAKSRHETLESAVSDSVAPHLLALQSGTKNKRSRKVNQPAKNVNEKEDTQIEFPTPPAKLLKRAITKNTTPPCMPTVFPAQKSLSLNRKETSDIEREAKYMRDLQAEVKRLSSRPRSSTPDLIQDESRHPAFDPFFYT